MYLYLINVQNVMNYAVGILGKCNATKPAAASQIRVHDGLSGRCDQGAYTTVSSDQHMLSGGVHAPVSARRGVLQRQFTFSHLGGQKGGKSGCLDMIAALGRRKDRGDAQRVLRETMGQLSCFQIRAHVFVWKWDVWRGLS